MNDRELITRLKEKDVDAFTEIVNRFGRRLFNVAALMTKNSEDSIDLYQETLYRALGNVHKFQSNSSLYSWLYRIMSNINSDRLRKKYIIQRHIHKFFTFHTEPEENAVIEKLDNNKSMILVRKIFKTLSSKQREAVILRFYEDLKLSEIADRQNVSIQTVKSRLYNALKKLRALKTNL